MKSKLFYPVVIRLTMMLMVLASTAGGDAMGQRYQNMTYTEADGLANSMVFDMVQDSAGVLWIARRSGISSYDGTSFSNYNVSDGLRSTSYAFLNIDEKERLWALPESGAMFVSRLKGGKWQNVFCDGQLPDGFQSSFTSFDVFYENGVPVVLAGTADKGFVKMKDKQWKIYSMAEGLPDNRINSVRGFEGNIYAATPSGLFCLHDGVFNPVQDDRHLLSGNIFAMERKGKTLWLLGRGWLGNISAGKFTLAKSGFPLPLHNTGWKCFLHAGRNGKIYFGNAFKIYAYIEASNSIEKFGRSNGLISEGASSVLVDREMNTWIAGFHGITKIPSERFASYTEKDGLFANEVASAMEISPGRYLFGHDGVLTFFDGKTMTQMVLDSHKIVNNNESRIIDMKKGPGGDIWLAACGLGVAHLDKNRHVTWYREKQGLSGVAYTVAFTPSGDLYAGTTSGLFKFANGRFRQIDLGKNESYTIRRIIPDRDGSIYMATLSMGLLKWKGGQLTVFIHPDNQLVNSSYAFFTDSKQRQLVGTAAGLFELEGREMKQVNRDGLMINRPVYLILEDPQGTLWVGTDNGVYCWNGKTMVHFTVKDGLSGQDINRAAGFVDNDHHIWLGTNNGVSIFRPELDYKPGEIPPPKVKFLPGILGKDTLFPDRAKEFPWASNDLSFNTRVISMINERQVFVRYYLEGADTGWSNEIHYTGAQYTYNNLNPGSYRFFLKARNVIGIWSEPVVSATFIIQPPFWLHWWILCLGILLLSGIIYIISRLILTNRYKNQLKEQVSVQTAELRESEMQLIESNAAKDRFFSIIAHDLRNPFNSILGFLDLLTGEDSDIPDDDRKTILLQMKMASIKTFDLLENLLTWARAQRGSLPFEPAILPLHEIIADNLSLFDTAASSKNITLINLGKEDFTVFADRNMISTVVRNLISNAIKFTFPGGTITIGMKLQDRESVLVYVKDNGMGIPANILENLFKIETRTMVKGTSNETGTGLGLILCKEFIEKNGGTMLVTSNLGYGSTFTFTLPCHSAPA